MTRRLTGPLIAALAIGISSLMPGMARAQDRADAPSGAVDPESPASSLLIIQPGDWRLAQSDPSAQTEDWLHTPIEPPPVQPLFGGDPNAQPRPPETDPKAKAAAPWPDISQPGPDMGDFPNSAYTLPKGRAYVEMAPVTLAGPDAENPSSYNWAYLLRYGVTDDVEFRIFGSGLTHIFGSDPETGFSPVSLDTKIHLWDQNNDWLIPAVSLEAYLQTTWGTKAFSGGWQESIALNFDMLLLEKTNLEWTIGYSGVQDAVNVVTGHRFIARHHFLRPTIHRADVNVYQLSIQWALEQEITEQLQLFFHGFYNGG
ncbi:MAG TPA: hypothetical protein VL475_00095, partial [Planctomycetaceae bacterium]|nr:hypothetical protein [Planctomycetaceae bacterium]